MYIVDVKAKNRRRFINNFEKKGFKADKRFSKEDIVTSTLPITLYIKAKEIGRMGNTTCVAATLSCGAIIKKEDFLRGETYRQVDGFWIY